MKDILGRITYNRAESNSKFNRQQNSFIKNKRINGNLFKLFEAIKYSFHKGHPIADIFLDVEKAFDQVWFDRILFKLASRSLNRTLMRWLDNFLY